MALSTEKMSAFLIVVAEDGREVTSDHLAKIGAKLSAASSRWLAPGQAVEFSLSHSPNQDQCQWLAAFLEKDRIDFFILPRQTRRRKKLLLCDMDSTIVRGETLDDLAARVGKKKEIAAITRRAMAGELDFDDAFCQRIAMLGGTPISAITAEIDRLQYTPGARELVQTMAAYGARCVLVSGGLTHFTEAVAKRLGFHHHHGNTIVFAEGVVTGKVKPPVLDRYAKKDLLGSYIREYGLQSDDVIAVGDGANDLEMLQAAGLGVGFHPKAFLRKRVENSILYGNLKALLYIQGFSQQEIDEVTAATKATI